MSKDKKYVIRIELNFLPNGKQYHNHLKIKMVYEWYCIGILNSALLNGDPDATTICLLDSCRPLATIYVHNFIF